MEINLRKIKKNFKDGKMTIEEVYELLKGIEIFSSEDRNKKGKVVGHDTDDIIISNPNGWTIIDCKVINDPENVGAYWYVDVENIIIKNHMNKEEAKKLLTNRKVYVDGKSKEIQEKLFEIGFKWRKENKNVSFLCKPFLFIDGNGVITTQDDMLWFKSRPNKEITAEEILSIQLDKEFKDGDIVSVSESSIFNSVIFIYNKKINGRLFSHISYYRNLRRVELNNDMVDMGECMNYANNEEQQILFDALEKEGKRWNDEKKVVENIKPKFVDGDIVYDKNNEWIFVYRGRKDEVRLKTDCFLGHSTHYINNTDFGTLYLEDSSLTYATEEQKSSLLDMLRGRNLTWNEKEKKIEKITHEFKPFERVITRDFPVDNWIAELFSHNDGDKFECVGGTWNECLPYSGNESLLGTNIAPTGINNKQNK